MNFKIIVTKISMLLITLALCTQCASSQQINMKTPVEIKDAYFQQIVPAIKGGGSGFMIYIEVNDTAGTKFKYAYFKEKKIQLTRKTNELVYTGRYMYPQKRNDLIMSSDPKEEFKNQVPRIEKKIPFELKEGECIIEYTKDNKQGTFKLDNLKEKPLKNFPM